MKSQISGAKMRGILLCGILGCILMGGSDWLMIYGDTAYTGSLAWLTAGAAGIAPWRNTLAMMLAFPAVIFYSIALFGIRSFLKEYAAQKTYCAVTAVSMTPWLCLHLFYIMILYLFSWLHGNGQPELAHSAGEALFRHFVWLVPVGEALILLPFLYLFYLMIAGRSCFPKWMAFHNPLLIYIVLKLVTLLLPDMPFRLALVNGLMSESMLIWFLVFLFTYPRLAKKA